VATSFLIEHESDQFSVSTFVAVEFLEGDDGITDGQRFLEFFQWIDVTPGLA
jgi:hypothetical protein